MRRTIGAHCGPTSEPNCDKELGCTPVNKKLTLSTHKTELLIYGKRAPKLSREQPIEIRVGNDLITPVLQISRCGTRMRPSIGDPHLIFIMKKLERILPILFRTCQNMFGYSQKARQLMANCHLNSLLMRYCSTTFYHKLLIPRNRTSTSLS